MDLCSDCIAINVKNAGTILHKRPFEVCPKRSTLKAIVWPFYELNCGECGGPRALGSKLCLNMKPSPDDKVLALFKKKRYKAWSFKAYDRHGKRLIDWEWGDRLRDFSNG